MLRTQFLVIRGLFYKYLKPYFGIIDKVLSRRLTRKCYYNAENLYYELNLNLQQNLNQSIFNLMHSRRISFLISTFSNSNKDLITLIENKKTILATLPSLLKKPTKIRS